LQFTADPPAAYSGVSIGLFQDCAATIPVASPPNVVTTDTPAAIGHDFGLVMQGNYYKWTLYLYNNGSQLVYLTYELTTYTADGK
jgi:hypothetical protein